MTQELNKIDATKAYQFLGCEDTGAQSGACCPHCGAEGRYIYYWAEFGNTRGAMAGCFAALVGNIKMSDIDAHLFRLATKQAKNKPLNGWDKTIVRMQKYIQDNAADQSKINWANSKISQAVAECKQYAFKRF